MKAAIFGSWDLEIDFVFRPLSFLFTNSIICEKAKLSDETLSVCLQKMINVSGVVSIVLFYMLILGVGIWAARKKQAGNDSEEEVMLAGRSIGLFVGIFTMTGRC